MGWLWDWWYDACQWQAKWGGAVSISLAFLFGSLWFLEVLTAGRILLDPLLGTALIWVVAIFEWRIIFASGEWKFMWLAHLVKRMKKDAYAGG